jgi:hypothetical protein
MSLRAKQLILTGACIMLLAACSDKAEEIKETVRPVKFQTIYNFNNNSSPKFTGVTKADVENKLSFRVG